MNLLMDALNKTEAARGPASAGIRIGDLPRISIPVEPIRATMDDEDSGVDEDSGRGDGDRAPPSRADTPAAGDRGTVEAGRASLGSHIGDLPRISMPVDPIRALADGEEADGSGGGRPPPMRADPPAVGRRTFDAPVVPRRRGARRVAGIALSVLAVTAGGVVGGHHVWKTELARPSLVRLPLPVSVAEAAPSWMPGAAASVAGEPDDRGGVPDSPGRGPGSASASRSVAQEDESTARAMGSVPAGVADHPPRTAQRDRAIPRSEAGTAAAPRPNPGAVPWPEPEADAVRRPAPGAGVAARSAPGAGIEIRKRRRPDRVAALLEQAYGMFLSGDVEAAAKAYRAVLGHEPHNRDAFLGLAAVVARAGRWDEAAAYYARILAFDPADAAAQAALIAIDERDPVRGESRLKALLSSEPRAAYLHFGLGNAYAAQSRWPEAQQSYFNAWRLDRGNADYAYNLAVSLDHLSRPESALDVYREALALAEKRPAGFEAAAVHARIRDLTAP